MTRRTRWRRHRKEEKSKQTNKDCVMCSNHKKGHTLPKKPSITPRTPAPRSLKIVGHRFYWFVNKDSSDRHNPFGGNLFLISFDENRREPGLLSPA